MSLQDRTLIWNSLKGHFCILSSSVHNPIELKQTLDAITSLTPKNQEKTLFCPTRFFQSHVSFLRTSRFSKIVLYPKEAPSFEPELPIVYFDSLEEALLDQRAEEVPKTLLFLADDSTAYQQVASYMEGSTPPNHLIVDLNAISHNIDVVRSKLVENTRLLVMVKAHGYGTEEAIISRFLAKKGVDILGVAHVEEALALRLAGIEQDLFVINVSECEMEKALLANAEVGLYTEEQIQSARKTAERHQKQIKVHLHIDTGMKRFGTHPKKALSLAQQIQERPHLHLSGIFSHFPAADDPNHDHFTNCQIQSFFNIVRMLKLKDITPAHIHISNSTGIFRFPLPESTMVRLGIALYGYAPSSDISFHELIPSLTLETQVSGMVEGEKGETVSYGRRHTLSHDHAKLAVLPLGYYDGLHRQHSNRQTVRIHSHDVPLVGSICMDYMMADVTHVEGVATGDRVILFGKDKDGQDVSPLLFAERGGTILHELLTCLGPRIRRLFVLR